MSDLIYGETAEGRPGIKSTNTQTHLHPSSAETQQEPHHRYCTQPWPASRIWLQNQAIFAQIRKSIISHDEASVDVSHIRYLQFKTDFGALGWFSAPLPETSQPSSFFTPFALSPCWSWRSLGSLFSTFLSWIYGFFFWICALGITQNILSHQQKHFPVTQGAHCQLWTPVISKALLIPGTIYGATDTEAGGYRENLSIFSASPKSSE